MLDFLVNLFTNNGYAAVFVALLVCGFGLPLPEDLTLIAGGVIAGLGYANVHVMHAVGLLGVLAGDSAMFLVGRQLGPRALKLRFVQRLLKPRTYARVEQKFARYGNRLMFVARFLPGLRAPIFLSAGITGQVRFRHFVLLDGLAALISVPIWVYLGYYGAQNHDWLLVWIKRSKIGIAIVLAILAVLLAVWWWRHRRAKQLLLARILAGRRAKAQRRRQRGMQTPR